MIFLIHSHSAAIGCFNETFNDLHENKYHSKPNEKTVIVNVHNHFSSSYNNECVCLEFMVMLRIQKSILSISW